MTRKVFAILLVLALAATLVACDKSEGEETTITGMVVSVDGSVIQLMEMENGTAGGNFDRGERPEGMEGFQGYGDFDPESFEGTMPEGMDMSQWGSGERPEMPEGSTMPEDFTVPEGMEGQMPEDFTMPEGMEGQMPGFGGSMGFDAESMAAEGETRELDLKDAHISVEIDGGKATGSMDDIKAGTFVTVTLNGKGEVTNVLVSSQSGFGGGSFGGGGRSPQNQ